MYLKKEELTKNFFLDITGYTEEEYNELTPEDIKDKWKEICSKDISDKQKNMETTTQTQNTCAYCGATITPENEALSRTTNKSICSDCATKEALESFKK